MYIFHRGQKFGDWEVIDPERQYYVQPSGKKKAVILCYDEKANDLRYVIATRLGSGKTTRSVKQSWSTRYKYKTLPMFVHLWQPRLECNHAPFRVCKKVNGKVKTYGYFYSLEQATNFTQFIK